MNREKAANITDRVIEYALYGLIVFIPISTAAIGIFSALAIVAFLVNKTLSRDLYFIKDNKLVYAFLGLFIFFMALSLFNSGPYLVKGFRAFFGKWLQYILIFVIVADTFKDPRRLKNAVVLMLGVLALVVLSGYSQRFLGFEFLRNGQVVSAPNFIPDVTSAFKNRNGLAAYLVFFLVLTLSISAVQFKRTIHKLGTYILVFLTGGALLLTLSRGGWLGFLSGSLFLATVTKKYKHILFFLLFFAIGVALLPGAAERAIATLDSSAIKVGMISPQADAGPSKSQTTLSTSFRLYIWQSTIAMIKENPFLGKGLGTFMDYFPKYAKWGEIYYAHNCYLQIWAESGIFALAAFLCFAGLILCRAGRTSFRNRHKDLGLVLGGFAAGLFGFLVHSFFDTHLYSIQLKALFWVMLGLMQATASVLCAKEDLCRP